MPDSVGAYTLEDRVSRLEVQMLNNAQETTNLRISVDRVADRVNGRPSWAVVTILSLSTMANGALLAAVAALVAAHK